MNLADLQTELRIILRDPSAESSFTAWINDELLQIAYEFDLPGLKLQTAASLVCVNTQYLYNLSAATHASLYTFHKKVWKVTRPGALQGITLHNTHRAIDILDPAHTSTGTNVTDVGLEHAQLSIFPMANQTLSLWFYRRPILLAADNDIPDFIPDSFHFKVIIPRVVLRAFRVYPELATTNSGDATNALLLWETRLLQGMYGDGLAVGLLEALDLPMRVRNRISSRFGATRQLS